MKIVINSRLGGFSITRDIGKRMGTPDVDSWKMGCNEYFGIKNGHFREFRTHPVLVSAVEECKEAGENIGDLKVIDIPDDAQWSIGEYEGIEYVYDIRHYWT
jgi:hypothetical protein